MVHRLRDPKAINQTLTETRHASSLRSLPFAELEALACALLSILLAFFGAGIAREEAFYLQFLAQLGVELQQRTGNPHLERAGLAVHAAARDIGVDIKSRNGLAGHQRLFHFHALRFRQEVFVQFAAVHLKLAAAGTQENPGHARFAASRAVVLNLISHLCLSTPCSSRRSGLFGQSERFRLLCLMDVL